MSGSYNSSGGLIGWFARNSVSANLLMLMMLFGGLIAVSNLRAETFPEVDPGTISVIVPYPGATPAEVEEAITKRVEEAITGIDGVERVTSSAAEGSGTVTVELQDFVNSQLVKDDVEAAVDQIVDFPPAEAEEPQITVTDISAQVMKLAIYGNLSELDLRAAAEQVEADILQLDEISNVSISGVRAREISIEVTEESLRQYGMSFSDVSNAVRAASVNLSGGTLRTSGAEILLQVDTERRTGAAFETIVISTDETGREILLSDIGTVTDAFEDGQLINTFQGQPAAFIDITAADDQDAFDVVGVVRGFLDGYAPPLGANIAVVNDDTIIVGDRLNLLIRNGLMGLALVFVFLAFTLDLRLAFWTTVGIAVAFLGAFIVIGQFTTINMISLFGLIVVLGLVVDDAIVIGESIYAEQQKDADGLRATVKGVMSVIAPVTIGVLTTMAAFAPLLFSTGTLGQILFAVPIVVISVLAMSLIEAFFVLPAHLSHAGDWSRGAMARAKAMGQGAMAFLRDDIVIPVVILATRARYVTLAVGVALVMLTGTVMSSGAVKFIFFPEIEADEVSVTLEMPDGTPFAVTEAVLRRVEAAALEAVGGADSPDLQSLSLTIGAFPGGRTTPFGGGGSALGSNLGGATLTLAPASERRLGSAEVERRWREALGEIPGIEALSFEASLVSGGADISIDLSHRDEAVLFAAVESLKSQLEGFPELSELDSGLRNGKRQFQFELTPAGRAAGLTEREIALQIRQAFFGDEVQRIQRGREEIRVFVRYPSENRRSLDDLERLRIRLPDGTEVPLEDMANIIETVSPTSIDRVDGRRVINVEADVDQALSTPNEMIARIDETIQPALLEAFPGLSFTYEGQSREQAEDLVALAGNLLISLMIIYVMLASILRSYVQPIVIMVAIPFGAVSAIFGHLILGYNLSFISLFGIVALSGVIVNGSVVLIDRYNKLRDENGLDAMEAALSAVKRRFRPIILTTLTTFLGLFPMLLETNLQAQFLIPMAISLGFGILFTGFMVMIIVPASLMILDDINRLASHARAMPNLATSQRPRRV